MRAAAVLLAVLILAGCDDRPTFDEQYDNTANQIEQRAAQIEAELNSSEARPAKPDLGQTP